jgi:hypothetical protein
MLNFIDTSRPNLENPITSLEYVNALYSNAFKLQKSRTAPKREFCTVRKTQKAETIIHK